MGGSRPTPPTPLAMGLYVIRKHMRNKNGDVR